jgi:uncharacterized protein YndB with AHSA1/START domain
MQDKIERKIIIKAPKEQVYAAITNPELIIKWFPDAIEGNFAEGEQPIFNFGEHGKSRIYVVAMRPHDYFAYRWVPGSSHFMGDVLSTETTLVEFSLAENDDATEVTMVESGFAKIPAKLAEAAFAQNSNGWNFMLGRLEKHFTEQ